MRERGSFSIHTPPSMRTEVLRLAAKRDRALGEEFLLKMEEARKREAENAVTSNEKPTNPAQNNSRPDPTDAPPAVTKRLRLAVQLLEDGDVERAIQFADPALGAVNIPALEFLSRLRVKNAKAADERYAALVARAPSDDAEFLRFAKSAREMNVPVYLVGRGDRLRFGEAALELLWPPDADADADLPSANNDSIVLRLRLRRRTFLLTGDAEAAAETSLVRAGDDLACDVLKVAHHGSRTSSTQAFVNATRPALAVISVGQDSPHGHPHAEVLARLRDSGALVLTTGASGTITVSTDGEDLKAATFVAW